MDIRKYEVFLAVVDRGSFIAAANDLGYTQSGITHMMNSLEKECGISLLMRSNKGVSLTLEGEQVLPGIRRLVKDNEELNEKFSEIRGVKIGKVRVGCYPTIACALMPKIIRSFREKYPHILIDIVEENSSKVLDRWLSSGFLDVVFFSEQNKPIYDWIPIKNDEYLAVFPKDNDLGKYDCIPARMLMGKDFLMFRSIDGIDRDVADYFTANKIAIESTFTSNSDTAVINMIDEGLGVGMQPKLILDICMKNHPNLITRPLNPPAIRKLGLAVRNLESASLATQRFIQHIQYMLEEQKL
jgi:DNA-binding transcriptional LysR family regulator